MADAPVAASWKDWSLRPLVLFVATYTIIAILHEWAHALTAYALKVPSVVFHLYVHIDRADGTLNERAIIGVAGPLFCLIIGVICWFALLGRVLDSCCCTSGGLVLQRCSEI